MRWKPEFLPDSMWLTQRWCLSVELLIAAILHSVLHAFLSFTPQRRVCSVLYTRNKKEESYFWSQRKVWRGAEMGTILPFKGHSGSGWFNKHLLGEDFHKKELSQSQDVSLFSNWRNYSAVVRHKCFEQSAKITWCTNGTHDWQEK